METMLAVVGLFVLRLGVPVVVMVLLAWAAHWYVRHEDMRALEAERRAAETLAATAPAAQNGAEKGVPVR
jgi:hypothetical protein